MEVQVQIDSQQEVIPTTTQEATISATSCNLIESGVIIPLLLMGGLIGLLIHTITKQDNYYSSSTYDCERNNPYHKKIKQKKGKKMPRFFRWVFYAMLIFLCWKFVSNIEYIVMFLANKFIGGI